jgi:mono/diheme cytochrome c family protein
VKFLAAARIAGAMCLGSIVTLAIAQEPTPPSVLTGAYSEEQAIRGQTLYAYHCLACHGEMMAGLDQAPPLVGPQFSSNWDGEPLWALVGRIGTMPPNDPGSLSQAESVDILTYILWYNGLPIGEVPLSAEHTVLATMTFQTPTSQ